MMELSRNSFKMRKSVVLWLFLIGVGKVQSGTSGSDVALDVKFNYYVMKEAHIQEYRINEYADSGYAPFYVECTKKESRNGCKPAIPHYDEKEGYVTVEASISNSETPIFYGCPLTSDKKDVYNSLRARRVLSLAEAKKTARPTLYDPQKHQIHPRKSYYNIYEVRCLSETSPILWRKPSTEEFYYIGYEIKGQNTIIPLAEVHFSHAKRIPRHIRHTIYAASLTVPKAPSTTLDQIIYMEDSDNPALTIERLQNAIQSYYSFNNKESEERKEWDAVLERNHLNEIPNSEKISVAHLIPEYDIPVNSWKDVARFVQTIAPMWKQLYHGVWRDVEHMIREYSFWNETDLTIHSGTHGQLTFDIADRTAFLLNKIVAFPEFIFKLVIVEKPKIEEKEKAAPTAEALQVGGNKTPLRLFKEPTTGGKKQYAEVPPQPATKQKAPEIFKPPQTYPQKMAIAIILYNLTADLQELKIFSPQSKAPCESICTEYGWGKVDVSGILFCCPLPAAAGFIDRSNFPNSIDARDEYDVLRFRGEKPKVN